MSNDKDFFNEIRNRPPKEDFDIPFPKKDKGNSNKKKAVITGILMGIAIAGIAGAGLYSSLFKTTENNTIPLIKKDTTAIKVRPDEPGGMEIPDRDKLVYNRIDGEYDGEVVERIMPMPEAPVAMPAPMQEEETQTSSTQNPAQNAETIEDLIDNVSESDEENNTFATKAPEAPKPSTKSSSTREVASTPSIPAIPEPKPVKKMEPKKVPEAPEPKPSNVAEKSAPTFQKSGYTIQLLSVKDRNAAAKAWSRIQKKHDMLKNLPYNIAKADLGSKGIYYRLQTGVFSNKSDALKVCDKLKANKQGCLVVTNK